MFNSVALNVVIGLVFIYLLYSLLVTITSELIATALSFRARNLKEGIDRMLNDEKKVKFIRRILDTLNLTKNPSNPAVNAFYDNPEIKYQGSSGVFKAPTSFKADSFSKTLMTILFGKSVVTKDVIENKIDNLVIKGRNKNGHLVEKKIQEETAAYIKGLWEEAQGDIDKFKDLLGKWFDKTMVHNLEWYKRKMRAVSLILGFLLAWFFNADTFVIVKNLSVDKDAREKLVSMANAYLEGQKYEQTSSQLDSIKTKQDLEAKFTEIKALSENVQDDILKSNNILGIGCSLPDSAEIIKQKDGKIMYKPVVESDFISGRKLEIRNNFVHFECRHKWCYFFWLLWHHFPGFLVTAIAISLGAPFWFDLLSKVTSLRTGSKEPTNAQPAAKTGTGE